MHSFSFHTTKAFPTLEGGMVTSDNEHLIEIIRKLRNFGINPVSRPDCTEIGLNCKMNEVQALIGLYMLEDVEKILEAMQQQEKETQENLQKKKRKGHKIKILKDW